MRGQWGRPLIGELRKRPCPHSEAAHLVKEVKAGLIHYHFLVSKNSKI
jgi:hypothetical protein